MAHIYDLCKGKNICEGGDVMDVGSEGAANQPNPVTGQKPHGGKSTNF